MSHVSLGERVYVKDAEMFGDVTRTVILGVEAVGLLDDAGSTTAFFGTKAKDSVISKDTGLDGSGAAIDVPVDIKTEGIQVLTAMNIPAEDQRLMFVKFVGMFDKATRRQYMEEWSAKKDDPDERAAFLQGLLTALQDDEAFITTQGTEALATVDPAVRTYMFERFLTATTKEQRVELILKWVEVKNSPEQKEDFLQDIYALLMDDDDYIAMEGRKAFTSLRILADKQKEIFTEFMATVSQEDRSLYVAEYRKVRQSPSPKKKLLAKLIGLVNTTEPPLEPY